jgi:predicted anti-sigma-YlaC factor YlaD
MDHDIYREWLDLEIDGGLEPEERVRLAAHLEVCVECRTERQRSIALAERLASNRVAVRPGFAAEVVAALEPAPWEARRPAAWRWPVALLVALAAGAAALSGSAATAVGGSSGWWTSVGALARMFVAGLVAGAGMVGATWSGVGAAVGEWLGGSPARLVLAIVAVVLVNVLAVRSLSRRSRAAEARRTR